MGRVFRTQVKQKMKACVAMDFADALGIKSAPGRIVGTLVCSGFTSPTHEDGVPCIPTAVFERLLGDRIPVRELPDLLRRQPWLPSEGAHYETVEQKYEIGGQSFSWVGHKALPAGVELVRKWSVERDWTQQ